MDISPILAHGSLGGYDELIYLGIAVIFLVMVASSWVQARADQEEEERLQALQLTNEPKANQDEHVDLE
ncbi:MAG UNVERIFIED_CONTAM: hypothetical protein LVT10_18695 [Anaerolineae bacterium]|jgi:choline-glycine betaine transporter